MRQINLRLPEELIVTIDELRGNVSRERFLRVMIIRHVRLFVGDAAFDARHLVDVVDGPDMRRAIEYVDEHRDGTPRIDFAYRLVAWLADSGIALPFEDQPTQVVTVLPPAAG